MKYDFSQSHSNLTDYKNNKKYTEEADQNYINTERQIMFSGLCLVGPHPPVQGANGLLVH